MAWIGLIDREHDRISVAASMAAASNIWTTWKSRSTRVARRARSDRPVLSKRPALLVPGLPACAGDRTLAHGARYGWASSAAIPLRRDGEIIGFFAPIPAPQRL
jgi:hypothetical protein